MQEWLCLYVVHTLSCSYNVHCVVFALILQKYTHQNKILQINKQNKNKQVIYRCDDVNSHDSVDGSVWRRGEG